MTKLTSLQPVSYSTNDAVKRQFTFLVGDEFSQADVEAPGFILRSELPLARTGDFVVIEGDGFTTRLEIVGNVANGSFDTVVNSAGAGSSSGMADPQVAINAAAIAALAAIDNQTQAESDVVENAQLLIDAAQEGDITVNADDIAALNAALTALAAIDNLTQAESDVIEAAQTALDAAQDDVDAALQAEIDDNEAAIEDHENRIAALETDVDSGEPWAAGAEYKAGEVFSHVVTQTTAVDVNGDAVPAGAGLFSYPVDTTAGATATLAEIAQWTPYTPAVTPNLFTEDLTTTAPRNHTLDHDFVMSRSNGNDNLTFEMELQAFGQFGLDARDYAADQNTVVSRTTFDVNGGAASMRFIGDSKLQINGTSGLPRQRVSSAGGAGGNIPGYQNPSIIKVEASVDFTTPPALNLANFGKYYWNNTASAQFPIGLYSIVSSFDTISGFDFRPETDACVVDIDDELSQVVNGALVPFDNSLFRLFDGMDLDNGALPPVASTFGGFPSVILEDAGSNTAHYGYTEQLPLTEPQTVRLKLKRDAAGHSFLLRTTGAGTQELIVSLDTGEVNVDSSGAGVPPTVLSSHVDTDTITVIATFQPNAGITLWDYFPAVGPAGIVGGGGYSGATQGTAELLGIDFNYAQSSFNCVVETILTPGSDWNISGGIAGTTNFTIGSAGQQDGVAEYNYATPVGRRGTKHVFGFELGAVAAGGNDIALRVEIEQGGEILEFQDLLTNETAQAIALEFFPTANVIIRIRDTSTGAQGSNRDAAVIDMQLVATCEGRSLPVDGAASGGTPLVLAYATTTSDRDDPNTGDNIVYDEINIVSGGVTIAGSTITLPQSDTPYELTWHGGFDFDGSPNDAVVFGFVGSTAPLLKTDAEADAFDTTISDTTFSAFQFIRTSAFALFDASASDITVELQVLEGATNIDITEGYLKVSQAPATSVVVQSSEVEDPRFVGEAGQPAFQGAWGNFSSATNLWQRMRFWRGGNRVYMEGVISGGSTGTIFTLPEGYRPAERHMVDVNATNTSGRASIQPNGEVVHDFGATTFVTLNYSFRI